MRPIGLEVKRSLKIVCVHRVRTVSLHALYFYHLERVLNWNKYDIDYLSYFSVTISFVISNNKLEQTLSS